jgi:pilus assembly protein Flp/PilA
MRPSSIRKDSRTRIRQRGQGMTEYIIITALIAIAAIAAVTFFGSTVRSQVGAMGKELSGQDASETIKHSVNEGNSAASAGEKPKNLSSFGSGAETK